ncbi:MAG: hypothetical protein HFG02_01050 [Oscillibacter sp.]|nr:hypothetical protein [Oscillibacter sp.]
MDNLQMDEKLAQYRRCRRAIDDLKREAAAIESEVKAELEARGVEQAETAHYKVSWKTVASTRLDTKALKEERPEIYARYASASVTKRFTVS